MSTATGLRSEAWASRPSRCASSGIVPPPANGSRIGGGLPSQRLQDLGVRLVEQALVADVLPDDEPLDDARAAARARRRWASSVGNRSGWLTGRRRAGRTAPRGRRERTARPPQVQRRRVAVADRLLPRRLAVDRLERQRHLDQLPLLHSQSFTSRGHPPRTYLARRSGGGPPPPPSAGQGRRVENRSAVGELLDRGRDRRSPWRPSRPRQGPGTGRPSSSRGRGAGSPRSRRSPPRRPDPTHARDPAPTGSPCPPRRGRSTCAGLAAATFLAGGGVAVGDGAGADVVTVTVCAGAGAWTVTTVWVTVVAGAPPLLPHADAATTTATASEHWPGYLWRRGPSIAFSSPSGTMEGRRAPMRPSVTPPPAPDRSGQRALWPQPFGNLHPNG